MLEEIRRLARNAPRRSLRPIIPSRPSPARRGWTSLQGGAPLPWGRQEATITPETMRQLYGVEVDIVSPGARPSAPRVGANCWSRALDTVVDSGTALYMTGYRALVLFDRPPIPRWHEDRDRSDWRRSLPRTAARVFAAPPAVRQVPTIEHRSDVSSCQISCRCLPLARWAGARRAQGACRRRLETARCLSRAWAAKRRPHLGPGVLHPGHMAARRSNSSTTVSKGLATGGSQRQTRGTQASSASSVPRSTMSTSTP